MSAVEWGDKIAVTAKPAWLAGDVSMRWVKPDGAFNREGGPCLVRDHNWHSYVHTPKTATVAIRLPSDHFAYTAIAKGFEPWGGGDEPPADWDGNEYDVLYRDGEEIGRCPYNWKHTDMPHDVIGYRKRQPKDAVAFTAVHATDVSHVTVKRMTEEEANNLFGQYSYAWDWAKKVCLIREPTKAERIATKTGLTVEQVQSVIDAMEDN